MGIIGGEVGYRLLKRFSRDGVIDHMNGSAYADKSKLETLLGPAFLDEIKGKVVVDFGCGTGSDAVEMAQRGAEKVVGIDTQSRLLSLARDKAASSGVADRCMFTQQTDEKAEVVVALDSFEHFDDPGAVLRTMRSMITSDGCVIASFGPTWYHPLGGHLFSVFPWSHLLFTEKALIRWRSDFKTDGATRFGEVEGGLNQMTIRRFVKTVESSPFRFEEFEAVPIWRLRPIANRFTREFTTAVVRCKLVPRS